MGVILKVRRKSKLYFFIFLILVSSLLGPILFIHFPRTCIPNVHTNTNPHPSIVVLSGERCVSHSPTSKCRFMGDIAYYNRREYIDHHRGRYTLRDNFTSHFEDVTSQGFLPAWAKIKILLEELERAEHDWIFWIDSDALFVNMDIELERFVDERYSLLITKDFNDTNAGVFMLRVNDWSRKYMRAVMDRMSKDFDEQQWMITLLENKAEWDSDQEVKYLSQCSFNSYWQVKTLYGMYRPGDFVIHWAGHNYDPKSFRDWELRRYFKLPF